MLSFTSGDAADFLLHSSRGGGLHRQGELSGVSFICDDFSSGLRLIVVVC